MSKELLPNKTAWRSAALNVLPAPLGYFMNNIRTGARASSSQISTQLGHGSECGGLPYVFLGVHGCYGVLPKFHLGCVRFDRPRSWCPVALFVAVAGRALDCAGQRTVTVVRDLQWNVGQHCHRVICVGQLGALWARPDESKAGGLSLKTKEAKHERQQQNALH